jgi:hypothetical protein
MSSDDTLEIIKGFEDIDHIDNIEQFDKLVDDNCISFVRFNLLTMPTGSIQFYSKTKKSCYFFVVLKMKQTFNACLFKCIPSDIQCIIILSENEHSGEGMVNIIQWLKYCKATMAKVIFCTPSSSGGYNIHRNYRVNKQKAIDQIVISI